MSGIPERRSCGLTRSRRLRRFRPVESAIRSSRNQTYGGVARINLRADVNPVLHELGGKIKNEACALETAHNANPNSSLGGYITPYKLATEAVVLTVVDGGMRP